MYDANKSYDENYHDGPNPKFTQNNLFPHIKFKGDPKFQFLGIPLFIPFGVPAGPLLNSKYVEVALQAGFCLPTYKTVRSRAWKSHSWPNILKIDTQSDEQIFAYKDIPTVSAKQFVPRDYKNNHISISNSFGVPSQSPHVWKQDFKALKNAAQPGQHVVLSFQGTVDEKSLLADIEKTAQLAAETVEETGFSFLEINLSCPNESNEPIFKSRKDAINVLKSAHEVTKHFKNVKLIAKIGALDFESTYAFLSDAAAYIQAISAINTVSANILNDKGKTILGSGSQTGGVCGGAILKQGLLMCEYIAKAREKAGLKSSEFGIIGVGGVLEVMHFNNYRDAGADVVQAATGMMWNLELAQKVAQALKVEFECL